MDIAGMLCHACGTEVTAVRYGVGCDRCGIAVHNRCVTALPRCPTCTGNFAPGAHLQDAGQPPPAFPGPSTVLATRIERMGGQILDALFAAIALMVGLMLGEFVGPLRQVAPIVGLGAFVTYHLLADGLSQGQSLGKRVTKTAVVHATTGETCTFVRSLVRNASILVLGIIDVAFIFGPRRQRLGDKLANTLVIKVAHTERA